MNVVNQAGKASALQDAERRMIGADGFSMSRRAPVMTA